MSRNLLQRWLARAVILICLQVTISGALPAAPPEGSIIRPLAIDLSSSTAAPFVEWQPEAHSSTRWEDPPTARGKGVSSGTSAAVTPDAPRTPADVAFGQQHADQIQTQRNQLRDSLAQEGLSSATGRDELTAEVLGIVKWTVATLLVGGGLVVGLKRLGWKPAGGGATSYFKLVESMPLGRQGGLHLIEVGQERFIVAADTAGIKSVTLLPSWPALDAPGEAEPRLYPLPTAEHAGGRSIA